MRNDSNSKKILHKSVMTKEVISCIDVKPNGLYIDTTFGCGGHSTAILEAEPTAKVIALDWDINTIEINSPELEEKFPNRFKSIWGNFSQLYKLLKKANVSAVDGILADFGTSQLQINETEGLSFQKDSPLDMRISKAHNYFNAHYVINRYTEKNLAQIFFELGEESQSRKIAKAIVNHRSKFEIKTTLQLAELIKNTIPYNPHKRIHPATKVFQALRIYVNKELDNINLFLPAAVNFLKPNGRLVCISFHSLEDRIVKNFIRNNSTLLENLTHKPIVPTNKEVEENNSSRSAKLRCAKKINF